MDIKVYLIEKEKSSLKNVEILGDFTIEWISHPKGYYKSEIKHVKKFLTINHMFF
jgi:hypothetical protein